MFHVYILHSVRLNKFYIGQTTIPPAERLIQHNKNQFTNQFTKSGAPWTLFLVIECHTRKHAIQVERHIKRMKSKQYIRNLKRYPEIVEKLTKRYSQ